MFKSWSAWYQAYLKALDDNKIVGNTHGVGEDGIFFVFDRNHHDVLWTFDRSGNLKKYKQVSS